MKKNETRKEKTLDSCGGLKPINPIKPPKKTTKQATKKSK